MSTSALTSHPPHHHRHLQHVQQLATPPPSPLLGNMTTITAEREPKRKQALVSNLWSKCRDLSVLMLPSPSSSPLLGSVSRPSSSGSDMSVSSRPTSSDGGMSRSHPSVAGMRLNCAAAGSPLLSRRAAVSGPGGVTGFPQADEFRAGWWGGDFW